MRLRGSWQGRGCGAQGVTGMHTNVLATTFFKMQQVSLELFQKMMVRGRRSKRRKNEKTPRGGGRGGGKEENGKGRPPHGLGKGVAEGEHVVVHELVLPRHLLGQGLDQFCERTRRHQKHRQQRAHGATQVSRANN